MIPVEPSPSEFRQFQLLAQRAGVDPGDFQFRKFAGPAQFRVRVSNQATATVYDSPASTEWLRGFATDLESGVFGRRPVVTDEVGHLLVLARRALVERGLPGVLEFLNDRVPHRFTAVYRLDAGPVLRNVAVHDKHKHLDALDLRVVPLKDSFCQFVLRDGLFLTENSGSDSRLEGHPYAGTVNSYIGVPIVHAKGLQGTLCHFDLEKHDLPDIEFMLLSEVARFLPPFIDVA